ncbi:MAG: hypothetical protein IT459_15900 [Planctomycetes bacterium]|nr:hypothetical protein [Planctomycetota bacterium]
MNEIENHSANLKFCQRRADLFDEDRDFDAAPANCGYDATECVACWLGVSPVAMAELGTADG